MLGVAAVLGLALRGLTDDAKGLGRDQHTVFLAVAGVFAHRFGKPSR